MLAALSALLPVLLELRPVLLEVRPVLLALLVLETAAGLAPLVLLAIVVPLLPIGWLSVTHNGAPSLLRLVFRSDFRTGVGSASTGRATPGAVLGYDERRLLTTVRVKRRSRR